MGSFFGLLAIISLCVGAFPIAIIFALLWGVTDSYQSEKSYMKYRIKKGR